MLRLTMIGLVVAFSVVSGVQPALAGKSPAEVAIEKALDSPTTVEFFDSPLQDLVDWWKDLHKIEIQLDHVALEDVGLGPDSPVTADINGISLESALNVVLRRLDLTWTIRDDVLLITTPEEAESNLTTRIYEAPDLQLAGGDELIRVITKTIEPESWDTMGGPGAVEQVSPNGVDALVVRQTYENHRQIEKLFAELRGIAQRAQQ